jgi:hypothetical protein
MNLISCESPERRYASIGHVRPRHAAFDSLLQNQAAWRGFSSSKRSFSRIIIRNFDLLRLRRRRSTMLSDEDKNRIRLEEEYRHEIRQSLTQGQKPKSLLGTLNGIVDTKLGTFLLTTVLVGVFSWGFSEWQTHRAEQLKKNEAVKRLTLELMHREAAISRLSLNQFSEAEYHRAIAAATGNIEGKDILSSYAYRPVFPEYQERTLISLIYELEASLPRGESRKTAQKMREKFSFTLPRLVSDMKTKEAQVLANNTQEQQQRLGLVEEKKEEWDGLVSDVRALLGSIFGEFGDTYF